MRSQSSRRFSVALLCLASLLSGNLAAGHAAAAPSPAQPGGVVLDGYGGLHPFGGFSLDTSDARYWPGQDVARALVVRGDGAGGWVLDSTGGIHAFGRAQPVGGHLIWPGQDLARALVITSRDASGNAGSLNGDPAPVQGYLLDAHGGIHPFGGAPMFRTPGYWPNQDIAAGLDVHLDAHGVPDGALALDLYGGLHYSGHYPAVRWAPVPFPGHPVYQRLDRSADGRLYAVTRYGMVSMLAPGTSAPVSGAPEPQPRAWSAGSAGWRAAPSAGALALSTLPAYWSGYTDWGRWDILRDIALARTDNPDGSTQPASAEAVDELANAVTDWRTTILNAPSIRQSMPLDCEAAATAAALDTVGSPRSQSWVFSQLPVDGRRAQLSGGRPVRWGDAWTAFVGNVNASEWNFTGYGVYFAPIAQAVRRAGRAAFGGQNWSVNDLYSELVRGHPAVIWINNSYHYVTPQHWTGWDGAQVPYTIGDHAVLLYGVNFTSGTVQVMDDATGTYRTFTMGQFVSFMATYSNMAVVVE